jgi:hypothetical protein
MVTLLLVVTLVAAALGAIPGAAAGAAPPGPPALVPVMTANLYLGADVNPVLSAHTQAETLAAVAAAWQQVQATNFGARADAIARQIGEAQPMLVGLQEAVQYRTQTPGDGPLTPATTAAADHLTMLLDALNARGLHYAPVSIATGYDVELTGLFPTGLMDIRITQREVVLARTDLPSSLLRVTNPMGGQYAARITVPTAFPGVSISLPWAWASVDATVNGRALRFVTTHLDSVSPQAQVAQAQELLAGPAATALPLIVVGDFNSPADGTGSPTYGFLRDRGLHDVWTDAVLPRDGFTCCQDADLRNPTSKASQRIDVIWTRGPFNGLFPRVLGTTWFDRLPSGLWPSDHGFVAAALVLR